MEGQDSQLTADLIRRAVAVISIGGVIGMIAAGVTRHLGAVVALGCVVTGAVLILLAVTAVTGSGNATSSKRPLDEAQLKRVEHLVNVLVAEGASETDVRTLIGEAARLPASSTNPSEHS